jgi:hypothetical protein
MEGHCSVRHFFRVYLCIKDDDKIEKRYVLYCFFPGILILSGFAWKDSGECRVLLPERAGIVDACRGIPGL